MGKELPPHVAGKRKWLAEHYEPWGDYVEFGCRNGVTTEALVEPVREAGQRIAVFDTFGGVTGVTDLDGDVEEGLWDSDGPEALCRMLEGVGDVVVGDVRKTAPEWFAGRLRAVSLVLLDLDIYGPTLVALATVLPHVGEGGLIVADEYRLRSYPGERLACDALLGGWRPTGYGSASYVRV